MEKLSARHLAIIAGMGSALLLAAALVFQSLGYTPCELCLLQRWPHVAAALIAVLVLFTGWRRWLAWAGLLAASVAVGLAMYHVGVEYSWWPGPSHCSGGVSSLTNLSTQDLMQQLQAAPVVRCDEVQWRFLGLSMAAWNMICSAGLVLLWTLSVQGAKTRPAA